MSDFIAWSYTKNGMFSVRSAYSVEWNDQYGSKLKHSNGMGEPHLTLFGVRYGSYPVRQKSKNLYGVRYMALSHAGQHLLIDT